MPETGRAIMLGIRHRCGQEVQFWIPVRLVSAIVRGFEEDTETLGLSGWMLEEGFLDEQEETTYPEDLVEHLSRELRQRGIAFVDVEKDPSICPTCGALLRWLDALTEYAEGKKRDS